MKLYAEYIKEREDRECLYNDYAFLTYKVYPNTKEVSVYDIFTSNENRGSFALKNLIRKFYAEMKKCGISRVYGFTDPDSIGWKKSETMMLKYGFEKIKTEDSGYNHYLLN